MTVNIENKDCMDELTSRVFSFLRFPLIVAVIFIHCNLLIKNPELEKLPVFYFLVYATMKLVSIAVPVFFFVSGFLFFKEGYLDGRLYLKKLKHRVHSVLIPYVLWNIIYLCVLGMIQLVKPDMLVIMHKPIIDFRWQDYLWIFWDISKITGLADDQRACLVGAFWFLQCLFVMFFASPFIYYIIKQLRHFILLIIGLLYFTDFITEMPGIHCNALAYFLLGAYFSIMKVNLMDILKHIPPIVSVLVMIGAVLVSYWFKESDTIYKVTDLFLQSAVFSITANLIERSYCRENSYLVSSVFFVFAIHRLFSAFLMTISVHIISLITYETVLYLYFILTAFITVIASLIVYHISKKLFPVITCILNGHR